MQTLDSDKICTTVMIPPTMSLPKSQERREEIKIIQMILGLKGKMHQILKQSDLVS